MDPKKSKYVPNDELAYVRGRPPDWIGLYFDNLDPDCRLD